MSSGFWDKKGIVPQEVAYQQAQLTQQHMNQDIVFDEEALAEIQEEQYDVFEDEEEDMSSVLSDANLRLEQGRLYQMIMNHDMFGETDADPKAIRNVQREMRKFARDRMETMLGMRQEEVTQKTVVSSPFNDMEVTVLKLLASKMSKGATEDTEQEQSTPVVPTAPKRDGITAIAGTTRPKTPSTPLTHTKNNQSTAPAVKNSIKPSAPIKRESKPMQKNSQQPKSVIQSDDGPRLEKPINEMTPQELAAHSEDAAARNSKKYATMPTNMVPMPSPQQVEALYTSIANQPPSLVATIQSINNRQRP